MLVSVNKSYDEVNHLKTKLELSNKIFDNDENILQYH